MNISFSLRFAASLLLFVAVSALSPAGEQRQRVDSSSSSRPDAETRLDLNTADVKALESVPAIGPDGARAIVAARPFTTIDGLDRLKGISAERLEQIRTKVTVATVPVPANGGSPGVDTVNRAPAAGAKNKVDLNTADERTLAGISSIGSETAKAIVAARPFATLDELARIKGISAERLEQIRLQVSITPVETATRKSPAPGQKSSATRPGTVP